MAHGIILAHGFFCPRIARIYTKRFQWVNNGDLFGRTNLTNAMRADDWGMSCGVVPSRHVGLASLFRGLRPRLPSLRSVVPSRHLTQVTKALKMFEFVRFVRPNRSPLLRRAMDSCRFVRFVDKKNKSFVDLNKNNSRTNNYNPNHTHKNT